MNSKEFYSEMRKRGEHYERLARAVVKQIGGWEQFMLSAPDIAEHSIDGGFHGFIYYVDTVKFAAKNRKDILAMAKDQAQDFGNSSIYEMFSHFRCMGGITIEEIVEGIHEKKDDGVYNCLAWYAGEEIASAYYDLKAEDE